MKVLIFNESTNIKGGIDTVIINHIKGLKANGIKVDYFQFSHKEYLESTLTDKLAYAKLYLSKTYKKKLILKKVEDYKPDIIHVHNIYPFFRENIFTDSIFHSIRIVFHLHNYYPFCINSLFFNKNKICNKCLTYNSYNNAVIDKCYNNSYTQSLISTINRPKPQTWIQEQEAIDLFLPVSNFLYNKYLSYGINPKKMEILPNSVEYDSIEKYNPEGEYVLFIGNIIEAKGARIFCEIAKRNNDIKFIISGDGRALLKLKSGYGQVSNLKFTGYINSNEKDMLIKGAKFLFLPSQQWETFGIVFLEALLRGKAVITSGFGAISEMIINNQNGLLISSNDFDEYESAVRKLWYNSEILDHTNWEKYLDKYTLQSTINKLIKVYKSIL